MLKMGFSWIVVAGLTIFVFGGQPAWGQVGDVEDFQIFPHIFHVNSANTSVIFVQNVSSGAINTTIDFFDQSGEYLPGGNASIAVNGSLQHTNIPTNPATGQFVGSALVFCSGPCIATANWSFNVSPTQNFNVGALPQLSSRRSKRWGAPVPPIGARAAYGYAIYNVSQLPNSCTVRFYGPGGQQESSEQVQLVENGQVAQFAQGVAPGFFGSTVVSCQEDVISVGLIQDQQNGFPTSINYVPLE